MGRPESDDARRWRVTSLLLFALAIGILTGLGEWLFLAAQRLVTGRIVFLGRHAAWMKPLAEGLLFFGLAGLLVTIGSVWGRARSLRAVAFLGGTLGALGLLLLVPPLHWAARLVLALGIGVQFARLSARWLGPRERLARRVSIGVAAVPVALAIVWVAGSGVREGVRTARLADAAPDAPNVLLLILDTVRAHSLGLYGHDRPTTPVLERIAAQGARFDRAYAPSSWTLPSHASMFTGRLPHELTADWRRPLDATHPTLAEYFAERGYLTAGFVANMGYCGWETGLARGFQRYEDHPVSLRQLVVESSILGRVVNHPRVREWVGTDENFVRKSASDVNGRFLAWLESAASTERPFFAFLNFYDAHGPYQPPEPFRSRLASGEPRGRLSPLHRWNADPFGPVPDPETIRQEREAYEGSIAYLDHEIGRLVDELEARGRLDETILIITSDHGEEFGEHGVYDHGNSLYLEGLWVPLVIRYPPRAAPGRVVAHAVGLADLPATIVDLAELGASNPFPGASLAPRWDEGPGPMESGEASVVSGPPVDPRVATSEAPPSSGAILSEISRAPRLPDWFPVSRGDMKSLVNGSWHYILNGDGVEELYDLRRDPAERVDLAKGGEVIDVLADFRSMLALTTRASAATASQPSRNGR